MIEERGASPAVAIPMRELLPDSIVKEEEPEIRAERDTGRAAGARVVVVQQRRAVRRDGQHVQLMVWLLEDRSRVRSDDERSEGVVRGRAAAAVERRIAQVSVGRICSVDAVG